MNEGDTYQIVFWTSYGLLEPTVMQIGTTNAPANVQRYINNTRREALDNCASAYLDDVLIYSNSEKEHIGHDNCSIQQLSEAGLYLKPEKCKFHKETVRYLALIILAKGISMDDEKVETVRNWSREKKTKNRWLNNHFGVDQFLAFCNYYALCSPKYSAKLEPLTRLTKKNAAFVWASES